MIVEERIANTARNFASVLNFIIKQHPQTPWMESVIFREDTIVDLLDDLQNNRVFTNDDKKDYDAILNFLMDMTTQSKIDLVDLQKRMLARAKRYEDLCGNSIFSGLLHNLGKYGTYQYSHQQLIDKIDAQFMAFTFILEV
jgi:hypothetical protein